MAMRTPSLQNDSLVGINREIGSQFDVVKTVADNIEDVVAVANATATTQIVADNIAAITAIRTDMADIVVVSENIDSVNSVVTNVSSINTVANNMADINSVASTVVPNMAEILLADDNAAAATSMAATATTQAELANAARVVAEIAQGITEAKAGEASLSMAAAGISADLAAASASTASIKAGEAAASATAAHNSELAAAAILDSFDDRYLGAFASNPTVDNDGNALTSGALYFNTTVHNLRGYDAGLVDWIALSGVTFAGLQDVNLTSAATGDVLKWNGTDWVNTKAIGLNSLQLLGGTGTQGTMTWNADEETVDVVQNGAVLQLGQETQVHVRNNSGSSIADGKVVMATGTLGVSGRITAGLYDGTSDVKYVLGVATETIANGDDGKVTSFGKIRGINTSAWNEGDVLYTTTAGGLTNVAPTAGVKLAVAMVITKHAINGVIMVRVNGVNELAYEPKNTNIQTHISSTSNPHGVTKAQVGLGNVDNTSDINKPISTATQNALNLKAPLASPALTGVPTAPTAAVGTSTVQLATTEFVNAEIANDTFSKAELTMAIGNLSTPLLDIPLKNSLAMKAGVGSTTFTRASTATYIDRYGVLKTAAIDEPRFEKEGYLNEGASTNLMLNSEFDASWATSGCVITYNNALCPDGVSTKAALLTANGGSTAYTANDSIFTSGTTYTQSFFYKAGTYLGNIRVTFGGAYFGNTAHAVFTKDGDFVSITDANIIKAYGSQKLSNGWIRVWAQAVCTASGSGVIGTYLWSAVNLNAGETFYAYGAQLEALPFATSYIPTTSATVTRSADVLQVTRAGNMPNVQDNPSGFFYFVDAKSLASIFSSSQYILSIGNSTSNNLSAVIIHGGTSNIRNSVYSSGYSTINSATVITNTLNRIAAFQSNTENRLYINGTLVDLDANISGRLTQSANSEVSIYIGKYGYSSSGTFYGYITNVRIYDKALSSAEVALA